MRIRGMVVVSAAMWLAVAAPMSVAQTSAPVANAPAAATANMAATVAPAKAYAFDVVSIRQNISPMQMMMGPQSGPPQFGPHTFRVMQSGRHPVEGPDSEPPSPERRCPEAVPASSGEK